MDVDFPVKAIASGASRLRSAGSRGIESESLGTVDGKKLGEGF